MPPSSEVLPRALEGKDLEKIVRFLTDIKNGKVQGSNKVALGMVDLLEEIITDCQSPSPLSLCSLVRECGRLAESEPSAANMARRVLRAIRDESRSAANQQNAETGDSLQRLVLGAGARRGTLGARHDVRPALRDHVAELRTELESSWSSICSQSRELLHSGELILTYGADVLTENFLRSAAGRGYRLVVADSGKQSRAMASRLSVAGVPVTFVSASAVFALMSRVNKVVVGASAVLAGGTLLAAAGTHNVTTAASHYCVPVLALSPLYKLTPLYAFDQHHFNSSLSPHDCVSYQNSESVSSHAYAPKFDLIPPDHVSLVVTNLGSHSPSYIYRLLSELYDPKDYQFE